MSIGAVPIRGAENATLPPGGGEHVLIYLFCIQ